MLPVFLPALASAGGVLAAQWPQLSTPRQAVLQAATFSAPDPHVHYALGVPALAGLVLLVLRRRVVWVVGAHLFFAAMFLKFSHVQVASAREPLLALLHRQSRHQSQARLAVGEDPNHPTAPLYLLALRRSSPLVVRMRSR